MGAIQLCVNGVSPFNRVFIDVLSAMNGLIRRTMKSYRTRHCLSRTHTWEVLSVCYFCLSSCLQYLTQQPSEQATSVVTEIDQNCYTNETGCFSIHGFEYKPGFDDAYITWIANSKVSWTLKQAGMAADTRVEISERPIPQEPMYIIINFGMSKNFAEVDLDNLPFPATMLVDYIRVYQRKGEKNIGCDPKDFPTQDYINTYVFFSSAG